MGFIIKNHCFISHTQCATIEHFFVASNDKMSMESFSVLTNYHWCGNKQSEIIGWWVLYWAPKEEGDWAGIVYFQFYFSFFFLHWMPCLRLPFRVDFYKSCNFLGFWSWFFLLYSRNMLNLCMNSCVRSSRTMERKSSFRFVLVCNG